MKTKPDNYPGTPPSGEPVEPRSSDLRTQSSQCQKWQQSETDRHRNTNRGLRSFARTERRKQNRRTNNRNNRRQSIQNDRFQNRVASTGPACHRSTEPCSTTKGFSRRGKEYHTPEEHEHNKQKYTNKLTEDNIPNKPREGITPMRTPYKR